MKLEGAAASLHLLPRPEAGIGPHAREQLPPTANSGDGPLAFTPFARGAGGEDL